jgi:hypothetical protein
MICFVLAAFQFSLVVRRASMHEEQPWAAPSMHEEQPWAAPNTFGPQNITLLILEFKHVLINKMLITKKYVYIYIMPIGPSVDAYWPQCGCLLGPVCGCLLAPVWIPIRGAHMCS